MSTTVDERVVSMQFDNKHFESNVKTTMSTLEKFKQSLNLKGASKGLEEVNTSAKRIDMSGLGKSVETVSAKFSALQVMGVTALANITNSAVNAGKRIASALTIDPIKTGFSEYETKMNSIQTIKSNTASKGTTMEEITQTIDELNTYADKTIYNFAEMTRNIGTFTAAGIGLKESASAIQGIANLAAASGSTSQQASTAMYQISQALASGTVKLMDWNSVVNAGMGGELFQNALKETAKAHGVAVDAIIEKNGSFRESLQEGWITSEVLTETLQKMTKSGAAEYLSKLTGVSQDQIIAAQELADKTKDSDTAYKDLVKSMASSGKITEAQALNILKTADNAESAATKVKTFTQLWDTLKESAQSGWGKTWEIIVGDFDKAQDLFTGLSDFLGGFIGKMSDARNFLLEGALNFTAPWTGIVEKLNGAGFGKVKEIAESVGNAADKLKYFQDVVNDVWRGDYKNSDTGRFGLLKNAGYDDRVVQELVDKGYQYELTVEDIEAAHKKFGLTMGTTAEETKKLTDSYNNLKEEQLKEAGLTEEEIKLYMDLQAEAKRTGKSVSELADEMSKNDGRTLLIDSFKNAGQGLVAVLKAIGQAWIEIFPPMSVVQLYNIIKAINNFSKRLRVSDDTADKLKRTLKGVFAILDIVLTLIGGPLKWGFKALLSVLDAFDLNILDVTANMGDAVVKFRDWIDEHNIFVKGIKAAPEHLAKFVKAIQKWLTNVRETDNIGEYIVEGLVNGLGKGIKTVVSKVAEFANKIIEKFKSVLGIQSPSKVFFEFGKNIIEGLVNGVLYMVGTITGLFKGVGERIVDAFSFVDFGAILTVLAGGSLLKIGLNLSKGIAAIASPLEGFGDLMSGTGEVLSKSAGAIKKVIKNFAKVTKSFANVMNSFAFSIKMEALKTFAIAVGILAGIVAVLALMIHNGMAKDMRQAVGIIAVLAVILGGIAIAVSKLASASTTISKDGVKMASMAGTLAAIGVAMLLMAAAVKVLGGLKAEQYEQGMWGLVSITGAMVLVVAAFTQMGTQGEKADKSIKNMSKILTRMAIAMLLMVGVIKLIGMLSKDEMIKGAAFATAFVLFVKILAGSGKNDFTNQGDNMSDLGSMILKLVIAMGLMVGVCKLVAKLSKDEMIKGAAFAGAFIVFVGFLALIGKAAGGPGEMAKLGGMILALSVSMLLLVGVCKLVGMLSPEDMIKGAAFATAFVLFVGAITVIAKTGGSDMAKIGSTILAMSVAIGVMAAVCVLLGYVDPGKLAIGMIAVYMLTGMISLMLLAARGVNEAKGTMIGIAVTIGLLAAALVGLSFIKPEKLVAPTVALGVLLGMFALVLKSSKNVTGATGTIIGIAVVIAVLAASLATVASYSWDSTLAAAGALSLVMLTLVGVFKILSNADGLSIGALVSIGVLSIMINVISDAIARLKNMAPETAIASAIALSTLLIAMSASLLILQGVQGPIIMGLVGLVALTGVMALLSKIFKMLKDIAPETALATAQALSTLLLAMSASLVILGAVGLMGPAALAGVGVLITAVAMIGTFVAAIALLNEKLPGLQTFLNGGIEVIRLIGEAIGAFVGGIIAGFAESVLSILPMIGTALSAFFVAATPFINGVSNIDEKLLIGAGFLAAAILALTVAELISGVTSFITGGGGLVELGNELSAFIVAAMPFITMASSISADSMAGVKVLAETILILTAADLLAGLASFITGKTSFSTFANELGTLGTGIKTFSDNTKGIDADAVSGGAEALKALAEASKSIPKEGGWLQKIVGESGVSTFANSLGTLGTGIMDFANNTAGIDADAVSGATGALSKLVELANEIPKEGGWLQKIVGEKGIGDFGDDLGILGEGLADFAEETDGINVEQLTPAIGAIEALVELSKKMPDSESWIEKFLFGSDDMDVFADSLEALGDGLDSFADEVEDINIDAVGAAVEAISKLVPIAGDVDDLAYMFDEDDMDMFEDNMDSLGKGLANFSESVTGVDSTEVAAGARAGKSIADMASAISNAGGLAALVGGEGNNMSTFGTQLVSFGTAIKRFAAIVAGVDYSYVDSGVRAGKQIASMAREIANSGGIANFFGKSVKMDSLGTELVSFGNSIRRFAGAVEGVDTSNISNAVTAGKEMIGLTKVSTAKCDLEGMGIQLVSFGNSMRRFASAVGGIDAERLFATISQINNSLDEISNIGIDGLVENFSTAKGRISTAVTDMLKAALMAMNNHNAKFADAGESIIISFGNAVHKYGDKVVNIFGKMVSSALAKVGAVSVYNSFFYAGKNLATGFANGISANSYKAVAKATAMAEAAKQAAKEALGINSPSRVFYAIGSGVIEGFNNALMDGESRVFNSSADVANYATRGFNNAVSSIQRMLSMDLDNLQPTIRPVLDLSEVSAGAGAISGMLNLNPTIGARSNINTISSAMNRRQNGMSNNDIVSAINDLNDAMGNSSGNTYQINGITYDDGSNISAAVETLIHAANIERRI